MNNPYEPPPQRSEPGISRRQLIFGLLFGGLVLGTVFVFQWYRFRQMELEMKRAMQRAQQAEIQAREAELQAREQAERRRHEEFLRQQQAEQP